MNAPIVHVEYHLLSSLPDKLWHGDVLLLEIVLSNRGLLPWMTFGNHPVRLCYHWLNTHGNMVVEDGIRTELPTSVPPDGQVVVEMRVESPPEPGAYELVIDLVEEGFGWFAERAAEPFRLSLYYHLCTAPRITLINGNCVCYDAVGNHVVAELLALREAGYQVLLFVQHMDDRLPADIRRSIVVLQREDVQTPPPRLQWAINHFFASSLVIVTYSTYYALCDLIKQTRGVVLFDYHGVTPADIWGSDAQGYAIQVLGEQHKRLVYYADYAMTRSACMRDELVQTGLIPAECVFVTPLGRLPPPTATRSQNENDTTALPQDLAMQLAGLRMLLFVGRMARNKRLIDIVDALALVRQHHPDTCLLLVGDNHHPPYDSYSQEVQQRARELGCYDYVLFTGQVDDLAPYYQRCDVYVTASVHEGFCLPVIEAMTAGKPVVAARATALPETVNGGGLLFTAGDVADMAAKIMQLLDDAPQRFSDNERIQEYAVVSHDSIIGNKPIVCVTLRYGDDIVGGSERLMRGWAEQLARCGYAVELLTTCVHDLFAWHNQLPPGVEFVNGVTVRRFPIDEIHMQDFHEVQAKAIRGEHVSYWDEQQFMQYNLRSRAMEAYLHTHADQFACVLFAPYLFGTTYWGMQAVADKAIIVPCLHHEPVAHFQIVREMLESSSGILFNTEAERDFAIHSLHIKNPAHAVVGYGFDPQTPRVDADWFRQEYGLSHFMLYSGRLEDGKNVPLLLDYFTRYKAEHPACPLALVLTGVGSIQSVKHHHPDIHFLGTLPEHVLPAVFAAATLLCQPSLYESFSIVLMESWLQERPVLVHADCPVTSAHVVASGGGHTFHDYTSFRDSLTYMLDNPAFADEAGQRGRSYVLEHYNWPLVTERLLQGIAACLAPRSLYQQLAQQGIRHALQYTPARFHDVFLRLIEQAQTVRGMPFNHYQQEQLRTLQHVGMHGYEVRSHVPFVGRLIAWVRRHLTSHLKEPYLDPIVERQEHFNRELVQTLVPAMEQSMYEQRRLQREVAILRERLAQHEEHCR